MLPERTLSMRKLTRIIIHCADTPANMDVGVAEIRQWHVLPPPKGRGWSDIGYHYVVRRNATVEKGRDDTAMGAHASGHNADTIGICIVGGKGGFNFTFPQLVATAELIDKLREKYGPLKVIGHRDVDSGKECPTFDAGILFE
jgi:N-acetylmuramoyl-L-alanine amidase